MAIDLVAYSKEKPVALRTPPNILIYGKNGIGKSTLPAHTEFGAGADKPIYVNMNNRINHLSVFGRDMVISNYEQATDFFLALLNQDHDFKTCVIDLLEDLERIINAKVCADNNVESIEDMSFGKGYVAALNYWDKFYKMFNIIRDKRGITFVMLAGIDKKKHNPPGRDAYDIWSPKIHGKTMTDDTALSRAMAWADLIMPLTRDEYLKKDESGFANKKAPSKYKIAALGDLKLITKGSAEYITKDTYGLAPSIDASSNAWQNLMKGIDEYWASHSFVSKTDATKKEEKPKAQEPVNQAQTTIEE